MLQDSTFPSGKPTQTLPTRCGTAAPIPCRLICVRARASNQDHGHPQPPSWPLRQALGRPLETLAGRWESESESDSEIEAGTEGHRAAIPCKDIH